MHDTVVAALRSSASISGMIAAAMVSLDSGRRVTGWGFVVFVGLALGWIIGAALTGDGALGAQNAVLCVIDAFGVYRYLIRQRAHG